MIDKDRLDKFLSDFGSLCEKHGLVISGGEVKYLFPGELGLYLAEYKPRTVAEVITEPEPVHRGKPIKRVRY